MKNEIKSAPPPSHTVLFITTISAVCIHFLPSIEEIDEVAKINRFTTPLFPGSALSSLEAMGWIRIFFSFVALAVSIRFMIIGTEFDTTYLPETKLIPCKIKIEGFRTQWFFTGWSWNILGLHFFLSGLIPLLMSNGQQQVLTNNPWILRSTLLTFEVAAPNAFLVSAVVKYALWPTVLKQGGPARSATFKKFTSLMQHNANIFMVLFEVCILGGTPVLLSHIAVSPLFGVLYVLFVWAVTNHWCPEKRPIFPYFLMDTTLGMKTTYMLAGLVAVLMVFYFFFSSVEKLLNIIDGGATAHMISMTVLSSMVCRFRD
mmetsp:Transcript_6987/g.9447  ORF Transcript_6987/g.9447 Transcript_6987/m.9447 type:complete len:316 (-) Transcript_6987:99-1046(-)